MRYPEMAMAERQGMNCQARHRFEKRLADEGQKQVSLLQGARFLKS